MTSSLQPPDSFHLQAAEGWIGLGNYAEANDELEQIAAANRAHPDVLQLRWRIYADAQKWDACLDIATALTTMTPERRFGWIHRAYALDKLGRTLEAKDLLVSVVNDFEANSTIPYHLAQAGRPQVSRRCRHCGKVFEPLHKKHRYCRQKCHQLAFYAAHRDEFAKRGAAYRAAHPGHAAAYNSANAEKIAKRKAAYYLANRRRILKQQAAYRAAHPEINAAYRLAHRDEWAEYHAALPRKEP